MSPLNGGGGVTPDGCPVDAYASLPSEPELSRVAHLVHGRHSILDLGAGTGRIADPLARAGHRVVAVDESAEMLARVRIAEPLRARIEEVNVGEQFDAVLMLSHLVNTPSVVQRHALLRTAARHLVPDGVLVVQRHDPGRRLQPGRVVLGPVEVGLTDVDDSGWPTVRATTRYRLGDRSWSQTWQAMVLDDDAIVQAFGDNGLRVVQLDGAWVVAASGATTR